MNLAHNLSSTASARPEHVAVRHGATEVTYAQLERAAERMAARLAAAGVGRGDRVGVMIPNVPTFPVVYYAVLRLGAAVVPMNVLLKGREVRYYLEDSGAKLLVAGRAFAETASEGAAAAGVPIYLVDADTLEHLAASEESEVPVAECGGEDTAVILYTSGTTGTPKGAVLTHSNLAANCEGIRELMSLTPADVVFGGLPLFHSFGQTCGLNASVLAGATFTMLTRFDPQDAREVIARDGVTVFQGVPTMYTALLNSPGEGSVETLRLCVSGGASLPVEVLRGFEERFGCIILEGYGLSETSPVASFNHPDRERKPGSIGTPIAGVEMRVVDANGDVLPAGEVGEIQIRGHNVMQGYLDRPEATAEAIDGEGWFSSGDMAKVDEDGYFFIVDRKKDLIIRGGYNVYPREIEEVLYEHPAVREAAVVGVQHAELGEEVGAAVALKEGTEATPEELRDFVKQRVAAYKYPRAVWLVDELPKGPTGKVLKREIVSPVTVG